MNKSESIKELATALAKFQGEITNPLNSATVTVKTKTGGTYNYSYAPLDEILKLVRPLLAKNELSIVQAPYDNEGKISISTTLLHSSGEYVEYPPLSLKTADLSPQSAGSVITYARRYAISAILGIASDDDNDGKDGADLGQDDEKDKPSKPLSEAQIKRLYALGKTAGYDADTVNSQIKVRFNKKVNELIKQEYDTVCKGYEGIKK